MTMDNTWLFVSLVLGLVLTSGCVQKQETVKLYECPSGQLVDEMSKCPTTTTSQSSPPPSASAGAPPRAPMPTTLTGTTTLACDPDVCRRQNGICIDGFCVHTTCTTTSTLIKEGVVESDDFTVNVKRVRADYIVADENIGYDSYYAHQWVVLYTQVCNKQYTREMPVTSAHFLLVHQDRLGYESPSAKLGHTDYYFLFETIEPQKCRDFTTVYEKPVQENKWKFIFDYSGTKDQSIDVVLEKTGGGTTYLNGEIDYSANKYTAINITNNDNENWENCEVCANKIYCTDKIFKFNAGESKVIEIKDYDFVDTSFGDYRYFKIKTPDGIEKINETHIIFWNTRLLGARIHCNEGFLRKAE